MRDFVDEVAGDKEQRVDLAAVLGAGGGRRRHVAGVFGACEVVLELATRSKMRTLWMRERLKVVRRMTWIMRAM